MCGTRGAVERAHAPGEQAQAGLSLVLVGGLEQQLHAQAQAEHGHAGARALGDQLVEPGSAEAAHRLREGADAGHDDAVRRADRVVVGGQQRVGADVLERLLDAAAVAHAVVDDGDHVSVPLVDGIPVSVGSTATAARSARANAL